MATGLTDKKFYDCHLDAIGALVVDGDGDGALVFLCVHLLSVETTHYGYWVYGTSCFLILIDYRFVFRLESFNFGMEQSITQLGLYSLV